MDESDHAKIMHAIGRTLREGYAMTLKEPLPAEMTDLVERLEQLPRSEAAGPAQKLPEPIRRQAGAIPVSHGAGSDRPAGQSRIDGSGRLGLTGEFGERVDPILDPFTPVPPGAGSAARQGRADPALGDASVIGALPGPPLHS